MFKRQTPRPIAGKSVDTLVGVSTRVNGDIVFSGGFHLDGQVTGNVRAAQGTASVLVLSESASIDGFVEVPHVILHGMVKGDVVARERVELGATARVNGNIYYGVIEMANGAQIDGKLIHQPVDAAQTPETPSGA